MAEVDQILSLEVSHSPLGIELHHIKNSAGVDADTGLSSKQNLARLEHSGSKTIGVDRLESIGDLGHVTPENLLGNMSIGLTAWEAGSSAEMLVRKGLGQWVIVGHKDQRTVLEAAAGERIVNGHNTGVADTLPGLHGTDSPLIGQAITYTVSLELQKRREDCHTLKSAKSIIDAIFARLGLVDPARVAKDCSILLMTEI